jgi:hypothetical protein
MFNLVRCALVGVSALGMAAAVASAAPVAINSQARSVHIFIPSVDPLAADIDETDSATEDGFFSATLSRTLEQMGQSGSAFALHDSGFDNAGDVFSATGEGRVSCSATSLERIASAASAFELTFTLAEPRSYTLTGMGFFDDATKASSTFNVTLTGPGGTVASFAKLDFNPGPDDTVITPPFGASGMLPAGQYTLSAATSASGAGNAIPSFGEFSFGFEATAAGDSGGNPIPLPAAAGPAAVLLAGILARSARARLAPGCAGTAIRTRADGGRR